MNRQGIKYLSNNDPNDFITGKSLSCTMLHWSIATHALGTVDRIMCAEAGALSAAHVASGTAEAFLKQFDQ